MKNTTIYIFAPFLLFLFLILITDISNAFGGVFLYLLVMLASRLIEKWGKRRKKRQKKDSGH